MEMQKVGPSGVSSTLEHGRTRSIVPRDQCYHADAPTSTIRGRERFLMPKRLTREERFWSHVNKSGPQVEYVEGQCWVWTASCDKDGYGWYKAAGHSKAHRYSYALHYGEIPEGKHILHRCDQPGCVRGSHLFLGDCGINNADRSAKGRTSAADKHYKAKLTWIEVREIRRLWPIGVFSLDDLASAYDVSDSNIDFIVKGNTWRE